MSEQAPTWWEGTVSLISEGLRRSLPADQQHKLAQLSAEELPLEQRKRLAGRLVEELPPELQQEIATKVALELPPEHLENLIEFTLSVADPETLKRIKKHLDSGDKKAALVAIVGVAIVFVLEAWVELFVQAPLEEAADMTPEVLRQVIQRSWRELTAPAPETLGERRHSFEPEMVYIPAGEFLMGTNREDLERFGIEWWDWFERETPRHRVDLPEYWVGKYPVTNAQFALFVAAGGYGIRKYWTKAGWACRQHREWEKPRYWDDPTRNLPNHPVVGVSWFEAMAYCNWLADRTGRPYRLPSEAEWEKAARGTDGRLYPWGNELPDEHRCNFGQYEGYTTPVGQYSPQGDSPYGCADMAGNVWEWTQNLFRNCPYDAGDGREDLQGEDRRVVRGGSCDDNHWYVRCAVRDWFNPHEFVWGLGFRPVVAPVDSGL